MWYSIKIILKTFINDVESFDSIEDEIIFLLKLNKKDILEKKVKIMAKKFESEYFNIDKEKISWKLIKIISIEKIGDELYDGIEIFSTITVPQ